MQRVKSKKITNYNFGARSRKIVYLAESALAAKDDNIETYLTAKFNYVITYGKNMSAY
jgi:hypothetical protein